MKIKNVQPMALPGLMTPEQAACCAWNISPATINQVTRKREVVEVRQTLMVYRVDVLKQSKDFAAERYGKDRTSFYHAEKTVKILLETDKEFRKKHELFYKMIG
jgi:chromosomal replication initiation ATPase DnaA